MFNIRIPSWFLKYRGYTEWYDRKWDEKNLDGKRKYKHHKLGEMYFLILLETTPLATNIHSENKAHEKKSLNTFNLSAMLHQGHCTIILGLNAVLQRCLSRTHDLRLALTNSMRENRQNINSICNSSQNHYIPFFTCHGISWMQEKYKWKI